MKPLVSCELTIVMMLLLLLVCSALISQGSSLWSFSKLKNKEVYFSVNKSSNSVQVEAFINDLPLVNQSIENGIKFYLFTKRRKEGIELQINDSYSLHSSGFNFNKEIKVIIHGFANSLSSAFSTTLKNAYMKKMHNIIIVDWSGLCVPPFYYSAVDNVYKVGARVAELLTWLFTQRVSPSHIHIVGHSVGAHIAGIAGRSLAFQGLAHVARITGLDPAKPLFERDAAGFRLRSSDAEFVDCIHTCGGFLGLSNNVCSADFYPNGGTSPQPGCQFDIFGICSHQRAYKYFEESITQPKAFKAVPCTGINSYSPVNCSKDGKVIMGEHSDNRLHGIFYLATAPSPPYAIQRSNMFISALKKFSWYFI